MLKLVCKIVREGKAVSPNDHVEINGDETKMNGRGIPDLSNWNGKFGIENGYPWDVLKQAGFFSRHLEDDDQLSKDGWHLFYKPETDEDALVLEVASYDWFYHMSDDGRVYNAGQAKDRRIQDLIAKVGQREGIRIWHKAVLKAHASYKGDTDKGLFFLESYWNAFGSGK